MSNTAYSAAASDAACSTSPALRQLRDKNAAIARKRKESSEEYILKDHSLEEVRRDLREHCRLKLELCRSKKEELRMEREVIEEQRDLTTEDIEHYETHMQELEQEMYILQKEPDRLVGIALLANRQNLAQSWVHLANAYGMALATITSSMGISGKDDKIWPHGGREEVDQTNFRQLLIARYESGQQTDHRWCPITKRHHHYSMIRAAHIIPYALGETNAAFLFGLPLDRGYEAIWNPENGLFLLKAIEEMFDLAVIQIVPGLKEDHKTPCLKVVVLDQSYPFGEDIAGSLDGRELEFQDGNPAQPATEYLYVSCLLAALRRKRWGCQGWKDDYRKLFEEPSWPKIPLNLSRSSLFALATACNDIGRFEEILKQFNFEETSSSASSEFDEATLTLALFSKLPEFDEFGEVWSEDSLTAELKAQRDEAQAELALLKAQKDQAEAKHNRERHMAQAELALLRVQKEQADAKRDSERDLAQAGIAVLRAQNDLAEAERERERDRAQAEMAVLRTQNDQAEADRKREKEQAEAELVVLRREKADLETRLAECESENVQLRRQKERKPSSFGETILAKLRR
ncbi:hypothetical protein AYL99_11791 [Fonsecaea erecta]|uniref:HNH nuclease domain-containing protein n=1 Tax=Fonsecaea erecta TaxID=1367422 RepID=A0A178Z3D9_9EURO|nr:hypothetical protein AYL99_11791 [Fonsecaea erecta]OAP54031.1 hypothetical protein AYL99_11791 [Fonsecaea erecta]